ncbi:MAG: hypothetical protein K2X47_05310 [Bdellovibrionales bacterium]|nr:hypothetical protein [Bdellovibrionales bacterium]
MRKSLLAILSIVAACAVSSAIPAAAQVSIQELRAVEVNYYGGITGFDEAGYKTLKSAIGAMVSNGTISQFITKAVGLEGGSTFCVELNGNPNLKVNAITDVLETIHPSAVTIYNHNLLLDCQR